MSRASRFFGLVVAALAFAVLGSAITALSAVATPRRDAPAAVYDLVGITSNRKALTRRVYFPKRPHQAPGYKERFVGILAIDIPPDADLIECHAQTMICVKNVRTGEMIKDFRTGKPLGAFITTQMYVTDELPPDEGWEDPPGEIISVYSGLNRWCKDNISPYDQPVRFGYMNRPASGKPWKYVVLLVSLRSQGAAYPQGAWVPQAVRYHLIMLKAYRKRVVK